MRSFPIFVSFANKPPLVVGGGELAAVKTRLLLKRAATVDVAAKTDGLAPELAELARGHHGAHQLWNLEDRAVEFGPQIVRDSHANVQSDQVGEP